MMFGFYMLYKVIFGLIIPVFRVTSNVRRQFNDIQQNMQNQANAAHGNSGYDTSSKPGPKRPTTAQNKSTKAGEYIDFEEVK